MALRDFSPPPPAGPSARDGASEERPTASPPRCTLGVLFVHGIGEQREGDTLIAFGEPLVAWMREWIGGHGRLAFSEPLSKTARAALAVHGSLPDGVEVTYASLFPSRRQSIDPAHGVVRIRITHDGERQQCHRWLFAESWWGEQVQPPPVFDLLAWMFSRGPWIALAHAAEHSWRFTHPRYTNGPRSRRARLLERLDRTGWRHVAWPWAAIRFALATLALQLLLLVAAVFALIPVPVVRRYVSAVLQRATLILGDSYGLVANETQRGAILTRFRETVDWLQARCDKLVIVAHSQGTAVVHEALRAGVITQLPLLVTFGAGLVKLAQLRQCEVSRRLRLFAAGWIVPTALAAGLLHTWMTWGSGSQIQGLWLVVVSLYMGSLLCGMAAYYAWAETRTQAATAGAGATLPHRWVDLYASSDPVPQGPLTDHLQGGAIASERIINRRSVLSDHVSYWKNKPEFVSRVVAELDGQAGLLRIPDLRSNADFRRATQHHHGAILVLSLAWWGIILPLIAATTWRFRELARAGEVFIGKLRDGPLEPLAAYLLAPGAVVSWIARQLTGSVPEVFAPLGYASVVVIGVLLVAYLWWNAVAALLIRWDSAQLADVLGYEKEKFWGRYGTWLVWPFMALLGLLPPVFAYALWTGANPWIVALKSSVALVVVIALSLVALVVVMTVPRDPWAALKKLESLLWALAVDATSPGSDEPTSDRRGWNSWKGVGALFVFALMPILVVTIAMEKLTGRDIREQMILLPYAFVAVALLVRLFRLIVQRGHGAWIGVIPPGALLMLGAYAANRGSGPILARLGGSSLAIVVAAAIVYIAADRWLPARGIRRGERI